MSLVMADLERECALRLRRHVDDPSEQTLHAAYELGRSALAAGVGVMDMGALLIRGIATFVAESSPAGRGSGFPGAALEAFALEALSPFEMAHHGIREANQTLRRIDEAREAEIRRLGLELHDSAGQLLASVHLALHDLARDLAPDQRPGLERAQVLLVRAEEQLRRLSHEFRPPMLDDLGVGPALEHLAESVERRTGVRVTVRTPDGGRLPAHAELTIYRFAQEGLANVVRHSSASRATVSVERSGAGLTCTIEDDGVGFDPGAVSRAGAGGLGLRGIRERASGLGGTLETRSTPGCGTALILSLPLEIANVAAHSDR